MSRSKNTPDEAFSARLQSALGADKSTRKIARQLDVTEGALRRWAAGQAEPGRRVLARIAETTGVGLDWLVRGVGPMHPPWSAHATSVQDETSDSASDAMQVLRVEMAAEIQALREELHEELRGRASVREETKPRPCPPKTPRN